MLSSKILNKWRKKMIRKKRMLTLLSQGRLLEKRSPKNELF
jgi:hypothetical protein